MCRVAETLISAAVKKVRAIPKPAEREQVFFAPRDAEQDNYVVRQALNWKKDEAEEIRRQREEVRRKEESLSSQYRSEGGFRAIDSVYLNANSSPPTSSDEEDDAGEADDDAPAGQREDWYGGDPATRVKPRKKKKLPQSGPPQAEPVQP